MEPLDWDNAIIELDKVANYLLNDDHPVGGAKAAFFRRFGFRRERWTQLADALRQHARECALPMLRPTPFGVRIVLTGCLQGLDGRRPHVVAVWEVDNDSSVPRLVTAYPDDEGAKPA